MAGHGTPAAEHGRRAADSRMPPTIVFQGSVDSTVRPVNARRVAEQWLAFDQPRTPEPADPDRIARSAASTSRTGGRRCEVTRWYSARGRKRLEVWLVDGLGHAWAGGAPGGSYSDPRGPRASTAMWRFFSTQRLPPAAVPAPSIAPS